MSRFRSKLVWLVKEADAIVALVVAVIAGVVELLPGVPDSTLNQVVSQSTLVVLGLLAIAMLRDRARRRPVEEEVRESLAEAAGVLRQLPERFDRMAQIETLLTRTGRHLDDLSIVRLLDKAELPAALAEARRVTDRWIYKGGTGRYARSVTIPECVANARRERRTLLVKLELLDPTDEQACDAYARYNHGLSELADPADRWTPERARTEAYATILTACWHRQRFRLLDIEIGLSASMTTIRYDLSSSCVIITREDPGAPAMVIDRGRFFYDWCSTELQNSLDQSRRVPIEQARSAPLSDEPTIEEVRKLFQALGLPLARSFTDRDVAEIARKALKP